MSKANPEAYEAGGTLNVDVPTYVWRKADFQLFEELKKHHYCYILTARQMGKSSLVVRTKQRLEAEGISSVFIDLSPMRTITEEQWYTGHADEIALALDLDQEWEDWWAGHEDLGGAQKFVRFLSDYVLSHIESDLVIFIDEIDSTIGLPFSDDYFAAIRALFNRRAQDKQLRRLTFTLLGVASPADLIKDPQRTPFNIGKRIALTDFTPDEASPLLSGLAPDPELARKLLKRVLFWTNGHPYLSQRACRELATWAQRAWDPLRVPGIVDDAVKTLFLSAGMRVADSNLQVISMRISGKPDDAAAGKNLQLLSVYREIRAGKRVADDDLDPLKVALKLSGLVVSGPRGLQVRNRIYETVFDEAWVRTVTGEAEPLPDEDSEPAHDVFVSYSHEDSAWVAGYFIPALKASGLDVMSDLELLPGTDWAQELSRLREDSRYFVPVLSPAWTRSQGAREEFELMSHRVGKIVPVLLRPTPLPAFLHGITFVDFVDESKRVEAMRRLFGALGGQLPEALPSVPQASEVLTGKQKQQLIDQMVQRHSREDLLKLISVHFEPLMQHISHWESHIENHAMPSDIMASMLVDFAIKTARYKELPDLLAELDNLSGQGTPGNFPASGGTRLHAYVAMPFGTKLGADGKPIDFNRVYNDYIKPALEAAGLEVFRADEETHAGDLRTDLFQELLIADLVVVDLTLDNPNVWYALGVRHALRARGVVLVQSGRPYNLFDIYTDRRLNYSLNDGIPNPATLNKDRAALTKMAQDTLESWHGRKISPVFNLLPDLEEPEWKRLKVGDAWGFWDRHEDWARRIDLARRAQRAGDILVLAEEAPIAAFRAEAAHVAGDTLLKLEHFDLALEEFDLCLEIDPGKQDAQRKKGLCLQRLGRPDKARAHYQKLLEDNPKDPEIWALLGRVDKDAWVEAWRRTGSTPAQMRDDASYEDALLRAAIASYATAFKAVPGHYYSGINAIALMALYLDLTGDTHYEAEAAVMAGGVRWAVACDPDAYQRYWAKATLGDLEVLFGTPETVKAAYKEAFAFAEKDWFALNSTLAQLRWINDLTFRPDCVAAGIATFERALSRLKAPESQWQPRHVLLFSGHMVDAPNRPVPRFPLAKVPLAEAAIAKALDELAAGPEDLAFTQGASGGDLIFAEACQSRGVKLQFMQPFPEADFIERSVAPAAGEWTSRFYSVKSQLDRDRPPRCMPYELGESARDPYERCNLWLLYTALAHGQEKVRFVCLWNGQSGDGPGGIQHMMQEVKKRTGQVVWLDTRNLW